MDVRCKYLEFPAVCPVTAFSLDRRWGRTFVYLFLGIGSDCFPEASFESRHVMAKNAVSNYYDKKQGKHLSASWKKSKFARNKKYPYHYDS